MLKGINPILTGDLLKVLSDMGHAEEIVIADGNFAATGDSKQRPPIWVPSDNTIAVVEAILTVFPLDEGFGSFGHICERDSRPEGEVEPDTDAYQSFRREFMTAVAQQTNPKVDDFKAIPRLDFHRRAKQAYAIVATIDPRHYACFVLRKGALPEPAVEAV